MCEHDIGLRSAGLCSLQLSLAPISHGKGEPRQNGPILQRQKVVHSLGTYTLDTYSIFVRGSCLHSTIIGRNLKLPPSQPGGAILPNPCNGFRRIPRSTRQDANSAFFQGHIGSRGYAILSQQTNACAIHNQFCQTSSTTLAHSSVRLLT